MPRPAENIRWYINVCVDRTHPVIFFLLTSVWIIDPFAGVPLERTVLVKRRNTNRDPYGSPIAAGGILSEQVPRPGAAS